MSEAIYPDNLPGRAWPRKRAPVWKTTIKGSTSGREWRSASMLTPRYRYTLQYNFLRSNSTQQFQSLFGFFNARGGSFDDFLFLDPDDHTVTAQPFGVGDGTTTAWQLTRTLGGFAEPVFDVKGAPVVSVAGVPAHLLPLGGFELDSNADGLSDGLLAYYGSGASYSGMVFTRASGTWGYLQRVAASTLGTTFADQVGIKFAAPVAVVAGATYTISADIYSNNCSHSIEVDWYTATGGFVGYTRDSWVGNGVSYSRRSITAAAQPGAAVAYVYIYMHTGSGASPDVRIDNATFNIGASDTGYSAVSYTISATGLVTFNAAPSAAALTWSGDYYWRCRFDADDLPFEQFMAQFWKTGEVKLITVKP